MMNINKAREKAAQAWCEPMTSHLEMDVDLAEEFALILMREVAAARPAQERITVKQLEHALNCMGVDSAMNAPDYELAERLFERAREYDSHFTALQTGEGEG